MKKIFLVICSFLIIGSSLAMRGRTLTSLDGTRFISVKCPWVFPRSGSNEFNDYCDQHMGFLPVSVGKNASMVVFLFGEEIKRERQCFSVSFVPEKSFDLPCKGEESIISEREISREIMTYVDERVDDKRNKRVIVSFFFYHDENSGRGSDGTYPKEKYVAYDIRDDFILDLESFLEEITKKEHSKNGFFSNAISSVPSIAFNTAMPLIKGFKWYSPFTFLAYLLTKCDRALFLTKEPVSIRNVSKMLIFNTFVAWALSSFGIVDMSKMSLADFVTPAILEGGQLAFDLINRKLKSKPEE